MLRPPQFGRTRDRLLLDDIRSIATGLDDEDGLVGPLGKTGTDDETADTATNNDEVKLLVGDASGVRGDRALNNLALGVVDVVARSNVGRDRRGEE